MLYLTYATIETYPKNCVTLGLRLWQKLYLSAEYMISNSWSLPAFFPNGKKKNNKQEQQNPNRHEVQKDINYVLN